MNTTRTRTRTSAMARTAGVLAGLTLVLGPVATATNAANAADAAGAAGGSKPAPCAQEQKQADRAKAALVRVTAVFEKQQAKVKEAKGGSDLSHAKAVRDEARKAKKAQIQRVAKSQARLDGCLAQPATN